MIGPESEALPGGRIERARAGIFMLDMGLIRVKDCNHRREQRYQHQNNQNSSAKHAQGCFRAKVLNAARRPERGLGG